ncbi:MAG: PQ-loop domain-containing transporter [Patescibacteria group bacterium]
MLFHIHLRKRQSERRLHPYPAKSAGLRFLDRIIFVAGVAGPIATIPQIINIYGSQSAGNVSPITFGVYALFNIIWILYGLAHRETPIVVTFCLWFTVNIIVCIGALAYGA